MKTRCLLCSWLCVVTAILLVHCRSEQPAAINITATTSLLGTIVQEIGKDHVTVTTIVPAGMCPGHFDISSQNIKNLAESRILFNHGWEKWIDKLLEAVDRKPQLSTINVTGNIMVPQLHKETAIHVTTILCSLDRAHEKHYRKNLENYLTAIDSLSAIMVKQKTRFASVKVACSQLQEEFIAWLGFDIVVSYGRSEDQTPKSLEHIIQTARRGNVLLVIDNQQSGTDAGITIAREIGADHIVLTNFPLSGSYLDAVMNNFQKLMQVAP